ncbi:MAG TPA: cupin domain-containing protein [Thermoanaerobaculia bacterium]|jgi:mannose-6-phosphate isomerase-like protein (cupin superfamily)|nr:cupin domain-containing protein [Thermoanaerobaculia bacterium]
MAVELEGGCRVVSFKEGEPVRDGDLRIWPHFGGALSLRVLELHGEATLRNENRDEVLYVLEEERAIYIPAGDSMRLAGNLTIVSSQVPLPRERVALSGAKGRVRGVLLRDQPIQKTSDRWYRELIQAEITQFVGSIPPGRAPDHFHLYEEVICILEGTGVMRAGKSSTLIGVGSCIFLPRRQVHCIENTGTGELRLLGAFYPAGSPSVRYEINNSTDRRPEK